MATKNESLDFAIPSAILDFGQALPSPHSVKNRRSCEQSSTDQMTAMEERVLSMVKASPVARQAVGISDAGQSEADRRLRLRVFAYLASGMLRESTRGYADVTDVANTAMDQKTAHGEALLAARHEIGRLIVEGVLKTRPDGDTPWNPRVYIPAKSLQWMSGGKASLGIMSPQRMAAAGLKGEAGRETGETDYPVPTPLSAKTIRNKMSEHIVGLEGGQLDVVASRLAMHMVRASLLAAGKNPGVPNEIVLVLGESGTGKTFLCEVAGRATGFPSASANASEMTASGYVGISAEDGLSNLYIAAKGRVEAARFGIMNYDEFMKRGSSVNESAVTSTCVQNEMLRLLQGQLTQVGGKRSNYEPSFWVNTFGMFFFLCGHAPGLELLIERRMGRRAIGFGSGTGHRGTRGVLLDALESFGIVPEILNRLTAIIVVPPPSVESLVRAATADNGIIQAYGRLIGNGKMFFEDGAVLAMADHCLATKAYFRGLSAVVSSVAADAVVREQKGTILISVDDVRKAIARMDDGVADLMVKAGRTATATATQEDGNAEEGFLETRSAGG